MTIAKVPTNNENKKVFTGTNYHLILQNIKLSLVKKSSGSEVNN